MESFSLPHLAAHPLHLCLFVNVQNAAFLRQQLLDGNPDFEYAFLDASMLVSRRQALAACFRAINDRLQGRMKSRNVHAEIVFSFSPNNNLSESFSRFGIGEATKHVLVIKVDNEPLQVQRHLLDNVQGTPIAFTDEKLAEIRDDERVKKVYKMNDVNDKFVLGSIALKGS
ncbi:CGI-121-domain-containing protein [Piedraia hortae CBS 480.64]|uniref:EKC/KEOPS complex subunit CGI121 n=1 Tax=Piedraia hortae CBS 480.64 TaxID=1314780 RepID=A0A6A7BVI4_9PEZI|nr:CGI-121-domain-containing protein [Piedraia hortae CBS 480.64]